LPAYMAGKFFKTLNNAMIISKIKALQKAKQELQRIDELIVEARQQGLAYTYMNLHRLHRLAYKAGYKTIEITFFGKIRNIVLVPKNAKVSDLTNAIFPHNPNT
jgi:hypothetical protein